MTFSATSSSGSSLLTVTTGTLYGHDVKFVYDSSCVDTFISVAGGSIIMEYVSVSAGNSSGTIATNSFIILNGGSIKLTQLTFENFKSSSGIIIMSGPGTLLLDEIILSNITLSGSGSLIYSSGGSISTGNVTLINSNLSSISATGLNGSVINVNGMIESIYIYNDTFGPSINSGNGGAMHISNCGNVVINGSNFTGCTTGANGNGGAIYFGVGTSFTLINSSFSNSSALYGGAIFSVSEISGQRQIVGINFTNNSVQSGGNGNDIADNSTIGVNLYGMQSVINSTSNSSNSTTIFNFYIIQEDLNFDCLLTTSGCGNDPTYVSTDGIDSEACGTLASPCLSLSQGLENLISSLDPEAELNVATGDYTDTSITVYSIRLTITTNSITRPTLSLVTPSHGFYYYYLLCYLIYLLFVFLKKNFFFLY
jgi:hypothetical protein